MVENEKYYRCIYSPFSFFPPNSNPFFSISQSISSWGKYWLLGRRLSSNVRGYVLSLTGFAAARYNPSTLEENFLKTSPPKNSAVLQTCLTSVAAAMRSRSYSRCCMLLMMIGSPLQSASKSPSKLIFSWKLIKISPSSDEEKNETSRSGLSRFLNILIKAARFWASLPPPPNFQAKSIFCICSFDCFEERKMDALINL